MSKLPPALPDFGGYETMGEARAARAQSPLRDLTPRELYEFRVDGEVELCEWERLAELALPTVQRASDAANRAAALIIYRRRLRATMEKK